MRIGGDPSAYYTMYLLLTDVTNSIQKTDRSPKRMLEAARSG